MSEHCIVRIMAPSDLWFRGALDDVTQLTTEVVQRAVVASRKVHSDSEVSVVLSDDRELQLLNLEHRGIDKPTNVLSFPGEPLDEEGDQGSYTVRVRPLVLGDIVLAYETIEREAREQSKSLKDHLAHLLVHGVLHLVGFDHERDADAERMEEVERKILSGLGVADPYQEPAPKNARPSPGAAKKAKAAAKRPATRKAKPRSR